MRPLLVLFAFLTAFSSAGCVPITQFTGSPHVEGGADACRTTCEAQGLTFAGMVFLGAYTDGCICAAPGVDPEAVVLEQGTTSAAAAVGVELQRRATAEAAAGQPDPSR